MISIEEIKEKQEELNKMIEEYESQKEVVKDDLISTWAKNWKPKIYETYFYIDSYNDVMPYFCDNESLFEKHIKRNKVFQTEELAKKWLEIDTYLREKSFEPDWNKDDEEKFHLRYDYRSKIFYFDCYYNSLTCLHHFILKEKKYNMKSLKNTPQKNLNFILI